MGFAESLLRILPEMDLPWISPYAQQAAQLLEFVKPRRPRSCRHRFPPIVALSPSLL